MKTDPRPQQFSPSQADARAARAKRSPAPPHQQAIPTDHPNSHEGFAVPRFSTPPYVPDPQAHSPHPLGSPFAPANGYGSPLAHQGYPPHPSPWMGAHMHMPMPSPYTGPQHGGMPVLGATHVPTPSPEAHLPYPIHEAMAKTFKEMQDGMGPMAKRGSLYLTRFGAFMSLLGAGGAAAGVIFGGAAMATGVGLPVGAAAAVAGVAVLLAGLSLSALSGAIARSIARNEIKKDPRLKQKLDALKAIERDLSSRKHLTPGQKVLLEQTNTILAATTGKFGKALKRHMRSASLTALSPLSITGTAALIFSGIVFLLEGIPNPFFATGKNVKKLPGMRSDAPIELTPQLEQALAIIQQ